jgi:hypothetical protein
VLIRWVVMHTAMWRPSIIAIIVGAMMLVLGMIPGFLVALTEALRNFLDPLYPTGGPWYRSCAHLRVSGAIWLLVGGGVMMIVGLLLLLLR